MKTLQINLYSFNELSDSARCRAIETRREELYNDSDIMYWAIDDCYLFEPKHDELVKLFGDEYTKLSAPIIGNTRKIYFSLDRDRHLNAEDSIVINNEEMFLTWLRIPKYLQDKINFTIKSIINNNTIIEFFESGESEINEDEWAILENAYEMFCEHMDNVLDRIENAIEYYYSDENIIEDLTINEFQFTEDGKIYF